MRDYVSLSEVEMGMSNPKRIVEDDMGLVVVVDDVDREETCIYRVFILNWEGARCEGGGEYEVIADISCSYDGARYASFGDEGFIDYPDIRNMARAFAAVYKWEYKSEVCHSSDCDDDSTYIAMSNLIRDA